MIQFSINSNDSFPGYISKTAKLHKYDNLNNLDVSQSSSNGVNIFSDELYKKGTNNKVNIVSVPKKDKNPIYYSYRNNEMIDFNYTDENEAGQTYIDLATEFSATPYNNGASSPSPSSPEPTVSSPDNSYSPDDSNASSSN